MHSLINSQATSEFHKTFTNFTFGENERDKEGYAQQLIQAQSKSYLTKIETNIPLIAFDSKFRSEN